MSPLRVSGFSSQYLATDVEYLHRISCDQSIHGDFTLEMAIRGTAIMPLARKSSGFYRNDFRKYDLTYRTMACYFSALVSFCYLFDILVGHTNFR